MNDALAPGFYGKFPSLGDFVTRRLPRAFVDPWDAWLQTSVARSREQLGEDWLEIYLTSPIWRFVLAGGVCTPEPWAGVVMPSVDRVGRCFPLVVAGALPEGVDPFAVPGAAAAWFDRAHDTVLSALDEESFTLEDFDAGVEALGRVGHDLPGPMAFGQGARAETDAWRLPLPLGGGSAGASAAGLPGALLNHLVHGRMGACSLWWSAGSELVEPSFLLCRSLPPVEGYVALLCGDWRTWPWEDWADHRTAPEDGARPAAPDRAGALPADWDDVPPGPADDDASVDPSGAGR